MDCHVLNGGEAHVCSNAGHMPWDGEVAQSHGGVFGWAEKGYVVWREVAGGDLAEGPGESAELRFKGGGW